MVSNLILNFVGGNVNKWNKQNIKIGIDMFTANEWIFLGMCGIVIALGLLGVYSKWVEEHDTTRQGAA